MFTSIRAKFIIITVFVLLFSIGCVLLMGMSEHERLYKQYVTAELDAVVANLADDLIPSMTFENDDFKSASMLLALDRYSSVKYALILDKQRQVRNEYINPEYAQYNDDGTYQLDTRFIERAIGTDVVGDQLVIMNVVGESTFPLGYVLVVADYEGPLARSSSRLMESLVPLLAIILVVATVMSVLFHRRLLAELLRLSLFARNVKESGDCTMRFDANAKDEVGELAGNINAMLETIDSQYQVTEHTTELLMEQQESLKELANYDTLTKLPNRQFFNDMLRSKLAVARRHQRNLAVMFLDLDHFKQINDSLGHEVGDALLVQVASRIKEQLREGDVLARVGGDEFLILIPEYNDSYELGVISQRIISSMQGSIRVREWDAHTGVSIGIADAESATYDMNALIRNADMAMYRAKEKGRGTYAFFKTGLLEESIRKINIANALIPAIQNSQFQVAYQAKVDSNKQVCGFEALVRWKSDKYGFISPAEFIPIAEQSGRINLISRWMISQVFKDLGQIQSMSENPLVVSINLSTHDLRDSDFIHFIREKAAEHQIDTKLIQFEVTESAYLDNFEQANAFLSDLHAMGCTVALDDFGTGYSSLSYLTRIKVDTIKIDREFIENINESEQDTLIIETILDLAGNLGLVICAEGVETSEQSDFLLSKGCDELQGYFYSKPTELANLAKSIEHLSDSDPVVSIRH